MNVRRFVLGAIAVFGYVFAYEWLFHGVLLQEFYVANSDAWGMRAGVQGDLPWLILGQLIFAVLFAFVFVLGCESRGVAQGLRYGLLIGVLFVLANLVMYAVQPIPGRLLFAWVVGGFVEAACAGVVMALVYRPVTT